MPTMSFDSSRPRPRVQFRVRTAFATVAGGVLLTTLTPAVAQPTNPGDAEIASAETAVADGETGVSELAASIAGTQGEIDRLELEVGGLHEAVNKALVDLHDARAQAERARQDVVAAKQELDDTQQRINEAQATLDEISRAAYRRTATPAAVSDASGNSTTEDALTRQTYLRTTADKQRSAIDELDRLRAENANRESQLREARNVAEEREAKAAEAESVTRSAIDENTRQIAERAAERDRLIGERDLAQAELDAARDHTANLNGQRQEYLEFQAAEAARKKAEEEAAAAAEARRAAEEEAARLAAAVEKEEERAATDASRDAQETTEETTAAQAGETGEVEDAQSTEAIPSTAPEVGAEGEVVEEISRARETAEQLAREEEAATARRDAAAGDAVSAAAEIIAQSQPDHTNLDSPYPSVADEEAAAAEVAAVQNPEPAGPGAGPSGVETLTSVTDRASEEVSGSREEIIETAIARAESQMGTPYAWGGGTATGPSRGVRDGGVGDANGDFTKVGFDCSGLMVYAFAGAGVALPHYSGYQYQRGTKIDPGEMQRGDLIFYGPGGSQHVAIYLGDGMMLEAPNSGSVVKKSPVRWSGMSEHAVRLV